jgi:hypothetical protein
VRRAPWWQAETAFSLNVAFFERKDRWKGGDLVAASRARAAMGKRRLRRSIVRLLGLNV